MPPVIRDVYPYLIVRGGAAAVEFYRDVFGAEETLRIPPTATASVTPSCGSAPSPSCWPTSTPSSAS